jgi:PAS domain S-box-containing protein/putative nucleotidyltransferase with HDIG domain
MEDMLSVLVVDDDVALSKTLADILRVKGYAPTTVGSGKAALEQIERTTPPVAVIDLRLPDIDGLEVLQRIKKVSPNTECIVLTGYASESSAIEAINLGAYSYIRKPYDVDQLLLTIQRAAERKAADQALRESEEQYRELVENASDIIFTTDLEGRFTSSNPAASRVFGYEVEEILHLNIADVVDRAYLPLLRERIRPTLQNAHHTEPYELLTSSKDGRPVWVEVSTRVVLRDDQPAGLEGIARDITARKQAEDERQRSVELLRRTLEQTVYSLAAAVETRDPYTAGHQRRVADLALEVALELGLSEHQARGVYMAGLIHDVGKIHIPAEILSKPTRLTDVEWNLVKTHPQVGHDILKSIDFPWPVAQIVLQHHERIDGSGYPQGLSGEEIILEARILAVADVVEAMASHRPYRPALPLEEALQEIEDNKGTLYEARAVDACLTVVDEKGAELGLQ